MIKTSGNANEVEKTKDWVKIMEARKICSPKIGLKFEWHTSKIKDGALEKFEEIWLKEAMATKLLKNIKKTVGLVYLKKN